MTLNERLENWNDQLSVDLPNRLVLNVALAGQLSRNGYQYTEEALAAAAKLYDNKPVFLDHASIRGRPLERSTRDLVGSIINPRFVSGRIRGDIRVLESESGALFLKLVEAQTPGVGMSHVVLAERSGDGKLVQKISDVISVDVVVNPATTRTFTESLSSGAGPVSNEEPAACSACRSWQEQAVQLREERDSLQEDVHRLRAEVREHTDRLAVQRLIAGSGLPVEAVSECFQQQLLAAPTSDMRRQLLQDRMQLMAGGRRDAVRVVSQERNHSSGPQGLEDEFVRILKRRSR